MPKIAFIGAGSTVFAKNLIGDILSFPALANSTLSLHDIDEERLHTTEMVAHKIAAVLEANPTIETTTDRRAAVAGADYVITMFQIGGYKPCTVTDFEIPKKYGLQQTIADTLGIGGIMRALRTIPVLLNVVRDMEELCPDATLLNYVNPMAMLCLAVSRVSSIKTIGLCHSVQGTILQLAHDLDLPADEINYLCAGINHMAFYLKLERDGVDLYPQLKESGESRIESRRYKHLTDKVRYEMLRRTGYFVTESSEHFSEYVPWFIKQNRPDLRERYEIPFDEYIDRCENQIADWEKEKVAYEQGDVEIKVERSHEYGSHIIHSLETGEPCVVYGNVPNNGLIDNLPEGACVEVPCLVDKNGIQPTKIGALPPQLAALMRTNINVQELAVEAAVTGKREHIYHAAMMDPHAAAELDLEQIWAMVDDLIEAHGDWLPAYQ